MLLASPIVPIDTHEWISFEDDHTRRTWVFDATFLRSRWSCIFGNGCQGVLEIVHDGAVDPAMADVTGAMPIAAPAEIDMVVLRACGRIPAGSPHGASLVAPLAERIFETLDCDVLMMPSVSRAL